MLTSVDRSFSDGLVIVVLALPIVTPYSGGNEVLKTSLLRC
ncbi:hypothetical protein CPS_2745 [Colwellia psychrerythraea 34H]|uniref:Uncharacterized protein n=1 Tax=Colwellia psychrerythraea (strain 34H / ATCC BAA-681) TaxID=167879 RepID=Q480R2_COLP3|nr:hypothetical protein CPS_2745 [Colwellia psychrerythraea 34H]